MESILLIKALTGLASKFISDFSNALTHTKVDEAMKPYSREKPILSFKDAVQPNIICHNNHIFEFQMHYMLRLKYQAILVPFSCRSIVIIVLKKVA